MRSTVAAELTGLNQKSCLRWRKVLLDLTRLRQDIIPVCLVSSITKWNVCSLKANFMLSSCLQCIINVQVLLQCLLFCTPLALDAAVVSFCIVILSCTCTEYIPAKLSFTCLSCHTNNPMAVGSFSLGFVFSYSWLFPHATEVLFVLSWFSLAVSLKEKEVKLERLQDSDCAHQSEVTKLNTALQQSQLLLDDHKREAQELSSQVLPTKFLFLCFIISIS